MDSCGTNIVQTKRGYLEHVPRPSLYHLLPAASEFFVHLAIAQKLHFLLAHPHQENAMAETSALPASPAGF